MDPTIAAFFENEATDYVKAMLISSISDRRPAECIASFEFNCFDVTLDFENDVVTIEGVLQVGPCGAGRVRISEFLRYLEESGSQPVLSSLPRMR